jgi:hypothetical protein
VITGSRIGFQGLSAKCETPLNLTLFLFFAELHFEK